MLQNLIVLPSLIDVNLENNYFQQDGCASYSTNLIEDWFDNYFPGRQTS